MVYRKKNPPAFPCSVYEGKQPGMELRDYFAASALQGCCANQQEFDLRAYQQTDIEGTQQSGRENLAECCYLLADAMLKARGSNG